jgi:hypothetical protein
MRYPLRVTVGKTEQSTASATLCRGGAFLPSERKAKNGGGEGELPQIAGGCAYVYFATEGKGGKVFVFSGKSMIFIEFPEKVTCIYR